MLFRWFFHHENSRWPCVSADLREGYYRKCLYTMQLDTQRLPGQLSKATCLLLVLHQNLLMIFVINLNGFCYFLEMKIVVVALLLLGRLLPADISLNMPPPGISIFLVLYEVPGSYQSSKRHGYPLTAYYFDNVGLHSIIVTMHRASPHRIRP